MREEQTVGRVWSQVPAPLAAEARVRAARALEHLGVEVTDLRVRLSDLAGRVLAQANALVAGRRVRVQVAAPDCGEAVDWVVARLGARVAAVTLPWAPRTWPEPQDGARPEAEAALADGGRKIVRVKQVEPVWCLAQIAARTMDAMDYGAHLFTDAEQEMDAVVYRSGPTGYRLARLHPKPPPRPGAAPLVLDPRPAPVLTPVGAAASLDQTGLRHVFFTDAASGRGRLLYRRFDGHYGLIVTAS